MNAIAIRCSRFYTCSEHIWSYVGKGVIFTRHVLNAISKSCHLVTLSCNSLSDRVKHITTCMKLFSLVSVPFSVVTLKLTASKIIRSYDIDDREGVCMGSLSFMLISTDAFDSLTTFVNAALALSSRPVIGLFSDLGIPLGFTMAGLGTVLRTINIVKARRFGINLAQTRSCKAFLEEKLGIKEREALKIVEKADLLIEKKRAQLMRDTSGDIVKLLEKLYSKFQTNDNPSSVEIGELLNEVQAQLRKKIAVDALGIGANLFIAAALYLFCIGSEGAKPFALLATAFFTRLVALVYQDLKLTGGKI